MVLLTNEERGEAYWEIHDLIDDAQRNVISVSDATQEVDRIVSVLLEDEARKMYKWFRSKAQYCRDKNGKGTDDDSKVELREFLVGERDWRSLQKELKV